MLQSIVNIARYFIFSSPEEKCKAVPGCSIQAAFFYSIFLNHIANWKKTSDKTISDLIPI